ncbi:patatin-like phospholipase family protein [Parachlamydia sp. AcF125]|uniref:patatin-like phospholipase family protein n=1 Tax=Parachlamydia sp. AcF125 TaxID=2795736 RepID=UPI001BC9AEE9|nr:patatin-like phospholipase family protein [Parachlamydia sp. AcF125]MBS4168009.1 hypothetical protein [Parachlamydia sp. AcF125]
MLPPVDNTKPYSLWESNSLQKHCEEINQNRGSRERGYYKVLQSFSSDQINSISSKSEVSLFNRNFSLIKASMPQDIKERSTIQLLLNGTRSEKGSLMLPSVDNSIPYSLWESRRLQEHCEKINQDHGSREIGYYRILQSFSSDQINSISGKNELSLFSRNFSLIKASMPQDIKERSKIQLLLNGTRSEKGSLMLPSVDNSIPYSLWESRRLQEHCEKINQDRGSREIGYYRVLQSFSANQINSISSKSELSLFSRNFSLITRIMPQDIKERSTIQPLLNRTHSEIRECLRSVNALKGIKQNLKSCWMPARLNEIKDVLLEVWQGMPYNKMQLCKNTYEKCEKIYLTKIEQAKRNFKDDISSPPEGRLNAEAEKKTIYPILSLDGGGIRGIIPITVLVEIEKITKKPIASLFKLIGGTSTGGILALGLSKPQEKDPRLPQYTAQDLLNIYTNEHSAIFQLNPAYAPPPEELKFHEKIAWAIHRSKYNDPSPFLMEKLGNTALLSSALTDVVVTANTVNAIGDKVEQLFKNCVSGVISFLTKTPSSYAFDKTVHIFTKAGLKTVSYSLKKLEDRYPSVLSPHYYYTRTPPPPLYSITTELKEDFSMGFAAQATSAAPTFFPVCPHPSINDFLIDGGALQNNPALPCVFESLDNGSIQKNLFLLSLGTGNPCADLGPSLPSLWFELTQPESETNEILKGMLSPGAYHRLQYEFEGHAPGLDDTRPETIKVLEDSGKALIEENRDVLRNICKVLDPDSI